MHYVEPIASLANVMLRAMMNDHQAIVGVLDAASIFWKAMLQTSNAGDEVQNTAVGCDAGGATGPAVLASIGQDAGALASAGPAPPALAATIPVALPAVSAAAASDSDNIGTAAFLELCLDFALILLWF